MIIMLGHVVINTKDRQTQPNMETEGLPTIHVKKSPSFSMIDQLMTKARKVPTTTDKAKVVHGHLIRPSKPQTEIQKTHPTLSYILSKGSQVKPVEMYVPKGSSTSTLVIRGTGHGSSSGTGGQPPVKKGTVPTEGTETSGMGGAPGGQPPPPGPPGGGGGDDDGDDDDNGNESDDEDEDTEEVSDSSEDEEGAAPPDNGPGGGGGAPPPPPPGGEVAQGQSRGLRGPRGQRGHRGWTGPQGKRGVKGERGYVGPKGDKGDDKGG